MHKHIRAHILAQLHVRCVAEPPGFVFCFFAFDDGENFSVSFTVAREKIKEK